MSSLSTNKERNFGLDYIKFLSITFVIVRHLEPIKVKVFSNETGSTSIYSLLSVSISACIDFFYRQISTTAVPLFFIVSIFLFFGKAQGSIPYLAKRIKLLSKIYIFWMIVQVLLYICVTLNFPKTTLENLIKIFIGVEPSLPQVGPPVFYFLFNLILLTLLTFGTTYLNQERKKWALVTFFFLTLIFFEFVSLKNLYIPFYRLENFLVYIPIAIFAYEFKNDLTKYKYIFLVLYGLMSIHDYYLLSIGKTLGSYSRVSVIMGALTIFSFIFPFRNIYSPQLKKVVLYVAKYSLGLFALHKSIHYFSLKTINFYFDHSQIYLFGIFNLINVLAFLLTLLIMVTIIYIFRKSPISIFLK